jgi:hypothetical protein
MDNEKVRPGPPVAPSPAGRLKTVEVARRAPDRWHVSQIAHGDVGELCPRRVR